MKKHNVHLNILMLSHIRNCLSADSTWCLMCLGAWSQMGYIKAVTPTEPELDNTGLGSEYEW